MARKVTLEELVPAIQNILDEYETGVNDDVESLVRRTANKGAGALRQSSLNVIGGRYSRGWKYTIRKTRLNIEGIMYHQTPGLPHLLENGHATVNGGRVAGRPHIKQVEEILVKEFTEGVEWLL